MNAYESRQLLTKINGFLIGPMGMETRNGVNGIEYSDHYCSGTITITPDGKIFQESPDFGQVVYDTYEAFEDGWLEGVEEDRAAEAHEWSRSYPMTPEQQIEEAMNGRR